MKEQLEQKLIEILEKSISLAEQTGQFVIDQGNEVIQEFFLWMTIKHSMGILLAVIFVVFAVINRKFFKSYTAEELEEMKLNNHYYPGSLNFKTKYFGKYYQEDNRDVSLTMTILFSVIAGIIFCAKIYHLIFILVAPKLYLLNFVLKLKNL